MQVYLYLKSVQELPCVACTWADRADDLCGLGCRMQLQGELPKLCSSKNVTPDVYTFHDTSECDLGMDWETTKREQVIMRYGRVCW